MDCAVVLVTEMRFYNNYHSRLQVTIKISLQANEERIQLTIKGIVRLGKYAYSLAVRELDERYYSHICPLNIQYTTSSWLA